MSEQQEGNDPLQEIINSIAYKVAYFHQNGKSGNIEIVIGFENGYPVDGSFHISTTEKIN